MISPVVFSIELERRVISICGFAGVLNFKQVVSRCFLLKLEQDLNFEIQIQIFQVVLKTMEEILSKLNCRKVNSYFIHFYYELRQLQ